MPLPHSARCIITKSNYESALRQDLASLFQYVQRHRSEIAAIQKPACDDYHFEKMEDQLITIMQATEDASNTIMSTVEEGEKLLAHLGKGMDNAAN